MRSILQNLYREFGKKKFCPKKLIAFQTLE